MVEYDEEINNVKSCIVTISNEMIQCKSLKRFKLLMKKKNLYYQLLKKYNKRKYQKGLITINEYIFYDGYYNRLMVINKRFNMKVKKINFD